MPDDRASTVEPKDLEELTQSTLSLIKYANDLEKQAEAKDKRIADLEKEKEAANAKERVLLEKVAATSPAQDLVDTALGKLLDARLITKDTREKFANTQTPPEEVFGSIMSLITDAFQQTPELGHAFQKEASRSNPGSRPADPHGDFSFLN